MRERLAALDPVELLGGDRSPQLVDDGGGFPATSLSSRSRCSAHSRSRVARAIVLVVGDDVHLRVVQQRVGVEIRRADREPAVVDDADLGVDVDDVAQLRLARVHGAGEEAVVVAVGLDQRRDLAARDVGAVVRARGQEHDDTEVVGGRMLELVDQDLDDLRRPEELVLEIDDLAPPSAARRCTTRGSSSRRCGTER